MALLRLDLKEMDEYFQPGEHSAIRVDICAEIALIRGEIELRAKDSSKKSAKKVAKAIDNQVLSDIDSYEQLLGIVDDDEEPEYCEH